MSIHKEGFKTIFIVLAFFTALYLLGMWLFPANKLIENIILGLGLVILVIVLQFFRNPARQIVSNSPQQIIAPADGKVVVIEEVEETEFLKTTCRQISIFMSPFNVHINRNPISGVVSYAQYHAGKYLVAWHPKSSTENERTSIAIQATDGRTILFRQIAGALARRIVWYVKEGQKVSQGEEFGFIKFGSRVDIFIPLEAKVLVKIGDTPIGGKTVLAEW